MIRARNCDGKKSIVSVNIMNANQIIFKSGSLE